MKHLLNTLYILTPQSYLCREGETVVVKQEDETKFQLPIHTLSSIICFGLTGASPYLFELCGQNNVSLCFFSQYGKFQGRYTGKLNGNVCLRRIQYRMADDTEFCLGISKTFMQAKIANCRTVLLRANRNYPQNCLLPAIEALKNHTLSLEPATNLAKLRGKEGDAARTYFGVFNSLITKADCGFNFNERNRRPPLDEVNALLSFIYTLLAHDTAAALEGVGLDPAVGFYHQDRPGRPGLALDLMEEMRAFIADRLVLNLINLEQVKPGGFEKTPSGSVLMNEETRKTVLTEYQTRKSREIKHPYLKEKIPIGLLPHVQAVLLARYIRGELDAYPAFIYR